MATKMTRGSRVELAKSLRKRYLAATIKQKQGSYVGQERSPVREIRDVLRL